MQRRECVAERLLFREKLFYNIGTGMYLCVSIRESNPICPALVKFPPFWIVGLARRQPCCTLTHQKNENFPMRRVAEFPQSRFFS